MKLTNSEILYLSQVLFHLKNLSPEWGHDPQLLDILEKCELHFSIDDDRKTFRGSLVHDEHCVWHSEEEEEPENSLDDETEDCDENYDPISGSLLLELDSIKASNEDGSKSKLIFEKGISKSSIDISLDDGSEILCDIETITRFGDSFTVSCSNGPVKFNVQKFPKSWTSLLSPGITYKLEEVK